MKTLTTSKPLVSRIATKSFSLVGFRTEKEENVIISVLLYNDGKNRFQFSLSLNNSIFSKTISKKTAQFYIRKYNMI